MKFFNCLIFLILLLNSQLKILAQLPVQNNFDTIYILDYFYKDPPFDYRGSTTIFLPSGDSVILKTKQVQIMPVDFDQYAMLKILIPKDSSITLKIRLNVKKRKIPFERTENILLKATRKKPSIYYAQIFIENCTRKRASACPLFVYNSDNVPKAFLRDLIDRKLYKGAMLMYNASTGKLTENPDYYH